MTSASNNSVCSRFRARRKGGGIYSTDNVLLDWPLDDTLSSDDEIEQTTAFSIISSRIPFFANEKSSTDILHSNENNQNRKTENDIQTSTTDNIIQDLSNKTNNQSVFHGSASSLPSNDNRPAPSLESKLKEKRLTNSLSRPKKPNRSKKSNNKSLKVEKIAASGLKLVLTRNHENKERKDSISPPKSLNTSTKDIKLTSQRELVVKLPSHEISDLYEDIENNNVQLSLKKRNGNNESPKHTDHHQAVDESNNAPTPNVETREKRKTSNKDLQAKSADNTEDSMETEARIAMEFPKHNWLVKNIMKEKKLKEESQIGNVLFENGCDDDVLNKKGVESQRSVTNVVSAKEDTVSPLRMPSTVVISSVTPAITTKSSSMNMEGQQHNMISIVKPVQYYKENSPNRKRSSSCEETHLKQEKVKTVEEYDNLASSLPEKNKLLHTQHHAEDAFQKDDLKTSCPVENGSNALDLTVKEKEFDDAVYALDLSKKTPKMSCPEKEHGSVIGTEKEATTATSHSSTFHKEKPFVVVSKEKAVDSHTLMNGLSGSVTDPQEKIQPTSKNHVKFQRQDSHSSIEDVTTYKTVPNTSRSFFKTATKPDSLNCLSKAISSELSSLSFSKSNCLPNPLSKNMVPSKVKHSRSHSIADKFSIASNAISAHHDAKPRSSQTSSDIPIIDVDALEDQSSSAAIRNVSNRLSPASGKSAHYSRTRPELASGKWFTELVENRRKSYPEFRKTSTTNFAPENGFQGKPSSQTRYTNGESLTLRKGSFGAIDSGSHFEGYIKSFARNATSLETQTHSSSQQQNALLMNTSYKDTLTLEYTKRAELQKYVTAQANRHNKGFTNAVDIPRKSVPVLQGPPRVSSINHDLVGNSLNHISSIRTEKPGITNSTSSRSNYDASMLMIDPRVSNALQANAVKKQTPAKSLANPRFDIPTPAYLGKSHVTPRTNSSSFFPLNPQHQPLQESRLPLPMLPQSSLYNGNQSLISLTPSGTSPADARLNNLSAVGHTRPQHRRATSIPAVNHPEHSLVIPKHAAEAQLGRLSTQEAEKIAARLQVQKLELENRIHNLKVLEKQIYASPPYATRHEKTIARLHQDQKHFFHSLVDPEKRKINHTTHEYQSQAKVARMAPLHSNKINRFATAQNQSALKEREAISINDEKCIFCKSKAYFVCSGCRSVWYCSKHCQLDDWPNHSKKCA